MPKGPRGDKRSADVIGCAITVARIATGEIEDEIKPITGRSRSGKAGGKARGEQLSEGRRHEIAKVAADARWR